jgi:O-antigen chain-terminating methyltransferase
MFAAQVVEHLGADQLTELLALAHRKLAPGGLIIMETVNGHNPAALKAFWTDATHHHPLYPEVLLALCRLAGFESGEVRFPEETGDFNADVYANRDYAVFARKTTKS